MPTREEIGEERAAARLVEINERLKARKIRMRLQARSGYISLRGQFPPRPERRVLREDAPQRPLKQQRIPLKLILQPINLKEAEEKAELAFSEVRFKRFYWPDWLDKLDIPDSVCPGDAIAAEIEKYKTYWLKNRKSLRRHRGWSSAKRKAASMDYWKSSYQPHFNKLIKYVEANGVKRVEAKHLIKVITTMTEEDTRTRVLICLAFSHFAKWAGLGELDTEDLRGYHNSFNPTDARTLPTNEEVIEFWENIVRSKQTKDIFGVLAAYGLRNHEIYFIEPGCLAKGPELVLLDGGKTGGRIVYPHPPSWYERFHLKWADLPTLPNLGDRSNQQLGKLITRRLYRAGLGADAIEKVYNLRHADAVRRIMDGVPDTLSAKGQGHSRAVHDRIYAKHMNRRDYRAEFERQAAKEQAKMRSSTSSLGERISQYQP